MNPGCGGSPPPKAHCAKIKSQISQLWGLIETWGFRVDLPLDPPNDLIRFAHIPQGIEWAENLVTVNYTYNMSIHNNVSMYYISIVNNLLVLCQ